MQKAKGRRREGLSLRLCSGWDKGLMTAVWLLIIFGTCMIASTAVGQTTSNARAVLVTVGKQLVFILASYLAMWSMNRIYSMQRFCDLRGLLAVFYVLLMISCFAFPAVYGSHAWINLKIITLQPSEFGKPLMILMVASAVYTMRRHPHLKVTYGQYFRVPLLFLGVNILLLVAQKDFGTMAITAGIFFLCASIPDHPGIRKWQRNTMLVLGLGLLAAAVLIYSGLLATIMDNIPGMSHIGTRIENTINPYRDIYGEGYQPANALYGIGSSNIWGRGFGNSARKYGYLTQADNDYILAVIIEETGIFGLGFLTMCYGVIEYKLFGYALKTRDTVNKVVLAGTGTYMFLHFLLNVGGVSGLIPMTGIPLLFISSGGSSLLAASISIGMCQRVIARIRRTELKRHVPEVEFIQMQPVPSAAAAKAGTANLRTSYRTTRSESTSRGRRKPGTRGRKGRRT